MINICLILKVANVSINVINVFIIIYGGGGGGGAFACLGLLTKSDSKT